MDPPTSLEQVTMEADQPRSPGLAWETDAGGYSRPLAARREALKLGRKEVRAFSDVTFILVAPSGKLVT